MKNLTKIFVAVVALFAYSCVTDTTEDLGVKLGGQTEITLSLEESRTQLGEKVGDLYPLHWSDGDKISVNGVESSEASISLTNPSVATFTVDGTLATPYCIAYPAAPAGQVLFADHQTHAGDTSFGTGVATMYAYGEVAGAQLNHLTGVLKIGVTGSATLAMAQISTADRAPIAGAFELDFTTGELTATASSKSVINYNFPITADSEGFILSTEPQYIHVAVPAGIYDELYVTLYDSEGGVMYATVKADEQKPLAAGAVREFKTPILYAANASVFVVKDKASLLDFAAQAATLEKDVLFVADVDMEGEAWTPIEGYAGTVYGNGYAIKGMTAPLFGTTHASIKGLHLKDVNIEETANLAVGALARHIEASAANTPVVEHCSVSGSVALNNSTVPYATVALGVTTDTYSTIAAAGLVARAFGVTITDCVNHATIVAKQCIPTTDTKSTATIFPAIGGVAGYIGPIAINGTTLYSSALRCENHGDVSCTGTSFTGSATVEQHSSIAPYIAGVIATSAAKNLAGCTLSGLKNYGDITISGKLGGTMAMGGTIGYMAASNGSDLYNYGNVSISTGEIYAIQCGGVVGIGAKTNVINGAHNHGKVSTSADAIVGYIVCGGVLGYQSSSYAGADSANSYLKNSSNHGPVTILHDGFPESVHNGTIGFYYRIGGIAGWTQNYIENCHNYETGKVTCNGSLFQNIDVIYANCVGGIVGYKTVSSIHNSTNNAPVEIDLNITTQEGYNIDVVRLNAGGIVGYSNLPCTDCTNNGAVSVSGNYAGRLHLGGVAGCVNSTSGNIPLNNSLTNNGAVVIKKDTKIGGLFLLGGVAGYISKNENCINNGAVTIEDNVSWGHTQSYIGGCAGFVCESAATKNMKNNAPLTIGKDCTHEGAEFEYIGGVIGLSQGDIDGLYNTEKGVMTIGDSDYPGYVLLGGCLGAAPTWNDKHTAQVNFKIEHCENRGAINFYARTSGTWGLYLGGVFGYIYEQELKDGTLIAAETNYIDNYGPILIENDNLYTIKMGGVASYMGGTSQYVHNHESGTITLNVKTVSDCYIGGTSQAIKDSATDITNDGDITVNGTIGNRLYIGGVIMNSHNYSRIRCVNNGDITINAQTSGHCFVGGISYDSSAKIYFTDCHNTGNFTFGKAASVARSMGIGGIIGKFEASKSAVYNVLTGCSNSGNIIINGNPKTYCAAGGAYGLICLNGKVVVAEGFTNTGDIIFEGEHTGAYAGPTDYTTRLSVDLGGFAGWATATHSWAGSGAYSTWSGNIVNTGTMKFAGTSTSATHLGGFFGVLENVAPTVTDGSFINTGDMIVTGTYNKEAIPLGIGGFAGITLKGVANAKSYCNINAINYPTIGMITGSSRSSDNVVSNCQLGGTITRSSQGVENGDGDMIYTPMIETIDESNFQNYIYGGTTAWDGTNYDGCSFLSVAPTI